MEKAKVTADYDPVIADHGLQGFDYQKKSNFRCKGSTVAIAFLSLCVVGLGAWILVLPESEIMCGDSTANSGGERFLKLIDLWRNEKAGMFNQAYYSRVLFPDLFEVDSEENNRLSLLWIEVKAYICGGDGLSAKELLTIEREVYIWSGTLTLEEMHIAFEYSQNVSDQHWAQWLVDMADLNVDPKQILLQSLPTVAVDNADGNISDGERARFFQVCDEFGVSRDDAQEILNAFQAEVQVREKYDAVLQL
jgi:hypothetical protein